MEPLLSASCPPGEKTLGLTEMLAGWHDARIKMYLTATGLRLRKQFAPLFIDGEYIPLNAEGLLKEHVVAFSRLNQGQAVLAVVPRLVAGLTGSADRLPLGTDTWKDTSLLIPTELPAGRWRNVLTGERVPTRNSSSEVSLAVADLLHACPVALLISES